MGRLVTLLGIATVLATGHIHKIFLFWNIYAKNIKKFMFLPLIQA